MLGSQSDTPENRSIINVSSTSGLHGNVGQANYAAAKSAVVGLTKTIAKEWGPFGVRANTIAYGMVHTRCDTPNFTVIILMVVQVDRGKRGRCNHRD
jgi:NAD(P)-dependent dehydrogenase (short-subunit alcohol dehydrogenase family)